MAIWVLTTLDRPEGCQEVLDACEATSMTSPGVVWVDKGKRSHEYKNLRLPPNWTLEFAPRRGGLAAGLDWALATFPGESAYGWMADDTLPRTKRWDRKLERAAGDWNLSYARDLWLSEDEWAQERLRSGHLLSSGLVFGGKLVRAIGWWALPGALQAGHDTAWTEIVRPKGLYRYVENVVVEHKNWRTGKRSKDETDWYDTEGVAVRDNWVESSDYLEVMQRLDEAQNLDAGKARFSILLPTRNRQQRLDKAIASVLAQTRRDWELIVLDNSDSPQRVEKDKRIRHYRVPPAPVASLFDQALELAEGEIVCHFADDDLLPPRALEVVALNIGDADWLVAGTDIRDESGNVILRRGGTRESVEQTRRGIYMLGGAVYWRKSLSDELGGYRTEYDGAADFDLFSRFLRHSDPVVVNETLYLYTDWPGTDSNANAARQSQQSARIARGD